MSDSKSPTSDQPQQLGPAASDVSDVLHTLDRYRIERPLGEGSMAKVMLAFDKEHERQVAIKIPQLKADRCTETIEKRFLREAQAVMDLSHPNICPVYDIGLAEEGFFYSMAYVEGRPLDEILKSQKRFDEREAAEIIRKVASGVAAAHQAGVLHRDLKPGNIAIDAQGEPIILDFGLARFYGDSEEYQPLTLEGQTVGTPAYMSPEQAKGDRNLAPTTDIFSLGIILWEMLCGERPFRGDLMTMLGKIVKGPSPSPRTKRPDISEGMEKICLKALANKPQDRFQSMEEFEQALDDFLAGREVDIELPEEPPETVATDVQSTRTEISGEKLLLILGVIGVLIAIAVILMNHS